MSDVDSTPPDQVLGRTLNGWKEIAAYLGKSVRSVQRWEEQLDLPVRRIQTPKGQIVYADTAALDQWREARGGQADDTIEQDDEPVEPPAWWRGRHVQRGAIALSLALLVLVGAVSWKMGGSPAGTTIQLTPVRFQMIGRTLEALGAGGVRVWAHQFDRDMTVVDRDESGLDVKFRHLADIDGDGVDEVLVPLRQGTPGHIVNSQASDAVYCFDAHGKLKWSATADQTLSFGAESFGAPWEITDIEVSSSAPRRIWVSWHHHTWWPGLVTEITPDGQSKTIYVQAGRIYSLVNWPTPAGDMLAVGAVSVHEQTASVALLQPGGPPAFFSESPLPKFQCLSCGPGTPRHVYVFDRVDLAAVRRHPYVRNLQVLGAELQVVIFEGGSAQVHGISLANINPDFSLKSFQFADAFERAHREWEREGRLDHSFDSCPDRFRSRSVRVWNPDLGWRTVGVPAPTRP